MHDLSYADYCSAPHLETAYAHSKVASSIERFLGLFWICRTGPTISSGPPTVTNLKQTGTLRSELRRESVCERSKCAMLVMS